MNKFFVGAITDRPPGAENRLCAIPSFQDRTAAKVLVSNNVFTKNEYKKFGWLTISR